MQRFIITENAINNLLNYLGNKPYKEVVTVIQEFVSELVPFREQAPQVAKPQAAKQEVEINV